MSSTMSDTWGAFLKKKVQEDSKPLGILRVYLHWFLMFRQVLQGPWYPWRVSYTRSCTSWGKFASPRLLLRNRYKSAKT